MVNEIVTFRVQFKLLKTVLNYLIFFYIFSKSDCSHLLAYQAKTKAKILCATNLCGGDWIVHALKISFLCHFKLSINGR